MKLNALLVALAVAGGFAGTSVAQAATELVIDDWNITGGNTITTATCTPTTVPCSTGPTGRTATGGTSLTRGYLYTTVTSVSDSSGSGGQIRLGDSTGSGTFINDLNARGWGYWSWTAGGADLSGDTGFSFDYAADLVNADVILAFFDGTTLKASAQKPNLLATAGAFVSSGGLVDLATATAIDEIRLYVFSDRGEFIVPLLGTVNVGPGVSGLDFGIRNLKLTGPDGGIPEPATLALFGLGLAGLGAMRRKRLAA